MIPLMVLDTMWEKKKKNNNAPVVSQNLKDIKTKLTEWGTSKQSI